MIRGVGAIDDYLAGLDEGRAAFLRPYFEHARSRLPGAEEVLSYRLPTLRQGGKDVVAFAATRDGYSVYPFSGDVLPRVVTEADGFDGTKSSLHFTRAHPLPIALLDRILDARLAQLAAAP